MVLGSRRPSSRLTREGGRRRTRLPTGQVYRPFGPTSTKTEARQGDLTHRSSRSALLRPEDVPFSATFVAGRPLLGERRRALLGVRGDEDREDDVELLGPALRGRPVPGGPGYL